VCCVEKNVLPKKERNFKLFNKHYFKLTLVVKQLQYSLKKDYFQTDHPN